MCIRDRYPAMEQHGEALVALLMFLNQHGQNRVSVDAVGHLFEAMTLEQSPPQAPPQVLTLHLCLPMGLAFAYSEQSKAVVVTGVSDGSNAAHAGVVLNDRVLEFQGVIQPEDIMQTLVQTRAEYASPAVDKSTTVRLTLVRPPESPPGIVDSLDRCEMALFVAFMLLCTRHSLQQAQCYDARMCVVLQNMARMMRIRWDRLALWEDGVAEQLERSMNMTEGQIQEVKKNRNRGTAGSRLGLLEWLSLIHISEPTRLLSISYAVFCLKKKKENK
eukprot:TRINITY_DN7037_c0_g1_i2.p1 TRINITY_DN7037_c0_g1~~TRINITY_DN7037_c0_g1_i2.p1  ORF type:complete len:274 (-),score=73.18 TRINITY_DN7037_c0_g1_i2:56-877(-)